MFYTQGVKKDKCNPEHENERGRSRTEIFCEVSSLFHSVIDYIVLYTERKKKDLVLNTKAMKDFRI